MMTAECVKKYSLLVDDDGQIVGDASEADASAALDRLARKYASDHNVDYQVALGRVMADPENETLVRSYVAPREPSGEGEDPSVKIHKLAEAHMAANDETNYQGAVRHVLAGHPDLARTYASYTNR